MTFEITFKIEVEGIDCVLPENLYQVARAIVNNAPALGGTQQTVKIGPMGVKE